jgi:hypothetical protein
MPGSCPVARHRPHDETILRYVGVVYNWIVTDVRAVEPTVGADCDSSYLLRLSRGDERRSAMVEFAAPSKLTAVGLAREVLAPFLAADEPPLRLIVAVDGTVGVAP